MLRTTCKNVVESASDYLEGKLGLGKRALIARHLTRCHKCRRFLEQLRLTVAALPRLAEVEAANPENQPKPEDLGDLMGAFAAKHGSKKCSGHD